MKLKTLLIVLKLVICLPRFSNEQVISFSMRRIAYSTNQFGLDLLRANSKNEDTSKLLVFCPFCISHSLVMLLMGSQGEMADSLRHALYLYGLSENEINFAFFDMMNHLGVNSPTQKQQSSSVAATVPTSLSYKTPAGAYGSTASLYASLEPTSLNKAGLLAGEAQALALASNNHLATNAIGSLDSFGQRNDAAALGFKNTFDMNNALFQPYDFIDRNKLVHPFSPFNENQHRNNFIKFSTNRLNSFDRLPPVNSDLKTDLKNSNYLFGRMNDKRTGRAFGFKNAFWNSKSYLNPFGQMLNAFQNNFQPQYATSYPNYPNHPANVHQNSIQGQPDMMIEKFGQSINHQALNNIKLPNNFHYYNKHTSRPVSGPQDNQRNPTATPSVTATSTNRRPTAISPAGTSSSPATTESPRPQYPLTTSTTNYTYHHHHHKFHPQLHNTNSIKEQLPSLDNSIANHHSIRLGNANVDFMNHHHQQNADGSLISHFLSNIYVQRDFVINYNYHILLQKFYKTAIHPLDFIHNGEETRQHINAIVQMQTDNKICNILPERQVPSTQLLLVSALYFKGELDLQLNLTRGKSYTGDEQPNSSTAGNSQSVFHHQHNVTAPANPTPKSKERLGRDQDETDDSHQSGEDVWMEASRTRLRYAFDNYLNCSTVEMPFKDSMTTLVIMIPSDLNGMDTLLTKLNAQMLNDVINSLEIRRITIKVGEIES